MCHSCWQERSSSHFNQARPIPPHRADSKSGQTDRRRRDKKTGEERKTGSESRKWVSFMSCQVRWNLPRLFWKSKLTDNALFRCSSYVYFLSKPQAAFLTNKGESPGIWQSKVVTERIGWVRWEADCRFYETVLSRNRVDLDKCNWIEMSLHFTWDEGWLAACLLTSNMSCLCTFVRLREE